MATPPKLSAPTSAVADPSGAAPARRIALVLGGGGLKGFAHIGVMQAMEERGIVPSLYAGTSIGAMLAAARAGGMTTSELQTRAESLRRRDLFRINHLGMLMDRMRSVSIYLEEPLRDLGRAVVPPGRFSDITVPLLVNTVDLERGTQVVWGSPGLRDVYVQDAVYASCALPGYFPPGRVDGRVCVDGGVIDNLPVGIAALDVDLVIAVDVGSTDLSPITNAISLGFANIYMRAATTMMHALQRFPLEHWNGPPMILIRPKCAQDWMSFGNIPGSIEAGLRAARKALQDIDELFDQPGGVFPRRRFALSVDDDRCIGCGLCVALAPALMGLDSRGKAYPRTTSVDWSPADGDFVHSCPTDAIHARKMERIGPQRGVDRGVA
jgi:NTE family protein